MRRLQAWLIGSACVLVVVAAVLIISSPALLYRWTGSQYQFNRAVSRSVPKGAPLAQLEAVIGPATRTPGPTWLRKQVSGDPVNFPDGWRAGDGFVIYNFPGNSTCYFQVRAGRLVNYNPAVLADQPQEKIGLISRWRPKTAVMTTGGSGSP